VRNVTDFSLPEPLAPLAAAAQVIRPPSFHAAMTLEPVASDDFPAVSRLLDEGFPLASGEGWLARLRRLHRYGGNEAAEVPLGQLLWDGDHPVGVALTPASLRQRADGSRYRLVNLSSLYLKPDHRWRAGLVLRKLVADPQNIYIDLTPTAEVGKMLAAFGFRPVSCGTRFAVLPLHALGLDPGVRLRPWRPDDLLLPDGPPRDLVQNHRELGCVALVLEHAEGRDLLIYARRSVRRLPSARLLYITSHARLERHLPVLARHLLARGIVFLSWDARHRDDRGARTPFRPGGVWYARGDAFTDRSDFIGSELCLFGL
jgi:hypothetical protein